MDKTTNFLIVLFFSFEFPLILKEETDGNLFMMKTDTEARIEK